MWLSRYTPVLHCYYKLQRTHAFCLAYLHASVCGKAAVLAAASISLQSVVLGVSIKLLPAFPFTAAQLHC